MKNEVAHAENIFSALVKYGLSQTCLPPTTNGNGYLKKDKTYMSQNNTINGGKTWI